VGQVLHFQGTTDPRAELAAAYHRLRRHGKGTNVSVRFITQDVRKRTVGTLGLVWLLSFGAGIKELISRITYLATTEFVMEFIWNSMIFMLCLTSIPFWCHVISMDLPNKMISSCRFIIFLPNETK
jgi:hypothetical protein